MKIAICIFTLIVSGCAYVQNIEPPYANPVLSDDFSLLKTHEPNKPLTLLTKLDGVYASRNPYDEVRDVHLMHIIPGEHIVTAYCSVINRAGYTKGIGFEFKFKFEARKQYVLSCVTDSKEEKGSLVLKESGKEMNFENVKILKPGGGDYN